MWFLESISRPMGHLARPSDGGRTRWGHCRPTQAQGCHLNVLTPDRIPEFFIPPSLAPRRGCTSGPHSVQEEAGPAVGEEGAADLIPLRANPAEIVRLSESPHTRRKESLFHSPSPRRSGEGPPEAWHTAPSLSTRPESQNWALTLSTRHESQNWAPSPSTRPEARCLNTRPKAWNWAQSLKPRPETQSTGTRPEARGWTQRLKSRPVSQIWAQSLRPGSLADSEAYSSSAESSPFGSPLLAHQPCRALTVDDDDSSSSGSSAGAPRRPERASGGALRSLAHPAVAPQPPQRRPGLTEESWVTLDTGGRVRLSWEYVAESQRLRVRLVSGQGLYPDSFPAGGVRCCAAVCLMPGRTQRQRTAIVRRNRNPIFNQDFYFKGVTVGDLSDKALGLKVIHKGTGIRRDRVLGQSQLGLVAILNSDHTLAKG